MLCPACEAVRFPDIRASAQNSAQPSAAKKTRTTNKNIAVAASKHVDAGKNMNFIADSKPSQSDDEVDCVHCNEVITVTSDSIICDVCKHVYHQKCSSLSEEVFTVLITIVKQAGWVCCHCRNQFDNLKCSLTKVHEELAEMRVSLSGVIAEVNCLKSASSKQYLTTGCNSALQTAHEHVENDTKPSCMNEVKPNRDSLVTVSQLRLELHRAQQDATRRKLNLMVSGLPETCPNDGETSKESDRTAFVKFCEENLSLKPALAQNGCVRVGKSDGVRPRRLLVHLTSESSVANILAESKALRRSDDSYISKNVYFNPDLNPAEAQLAYKRREKRRQQRRAVVAEETTVKQTLSLNVNADPYVACSNDIYQSTGFSTAGCGQCSEKPPGQHTTSDINPGQPPFLQ